VFRKYSCHLALFGALLAGALAPSLAASPAGPATLSDHGTFEISMAGERIGAETFQIVPSGDRVIANAEIELHTQTGGKAVVFHIIPKLVLDSQLHPLSYTWDQKGAGNSRFEINFTTAPVKARYHTVSGKDDNRDFLLPKDVVVLDDNVLSQYEILLARYDRTSRGPQVFKAFIPQEALPGQLKIVENGTEDVTINGKSERLHHFVVTTDLARIDLWADTQGRVQRVAVPAVRFNAVRQQ
jgi:hypothetical protein